MTNSADDVMRVHGFILQATYRVQSGIPVVHLYGRLDNGQTFLVRDTRQRPHFYIAAADSARAAELGVTSSPVDKQTFAGAPVHRIDVAVPGDAPGVRDRLHAAGIDTLEADVRFAVRYLIDRGIRGSLQISGPAKRGDGVTWVFEIPELAPADAKVRPRVLSFDIETDPQAEQLLAISLFGRDIDEVYIVDSDGRRMPENATGFADERGVIELAGSALPHARPGGCDRLCVRQSFAAPCVDQSPFLNALLDVLIAVGGLTDFAAGNRASIVREQGDRRLTIPVRLEDLVRDGDISANASMAPGDILIIPQSWF